VHPYVYLPDNYLEHLSELTIPGNQSSDDKLPDRIMRWLFAGASYLPELYIERLAQRFPGKNIWITETGITGDTQSPDGSGKLFRLLFNVAYFASWMRHYPAVDVYLYHGLFYGPGNNAVLYNKDYSYTANGLALALIGATLSEATHIAVPDFNASPQYAGIGPYEEHEIKSVTGIYAITTTHSRLLLANSGNEEILLRLPHKVFKAIQYGGDPQSSLYSSPIDSLRSLLEKQIDDGVFILKPFSVALLEAQGNMLERLTNQEN